MSSLSESRDALDEMRGSKVALQSTLHELRASMQQLEKEAALRRAGDAVDKAVRGGIREGVDGMYGMHVYI